jgi:diguanylate cyclase (GGDEF)-like protein
MFRINPNVLNEEQRMLIPLRPDAKMTDKSAKPSDIPKPFDPQSLSRIELQKMLAEYERSIEIQHVLCDIANIPIEEAKISQFYIAIHKALSKIIYSDNIIIASMDEKQERLSFDYFKDTVDDLSTEDIDSLPAHRVKYTFTGYVLRTGEPLLANNQEMKKLLEAGEVSQLGTECVSWLGVPLKLEDRIYGVIAVQSYKKTIKFNHDDLELLQFVANHISSAISRKKLNLDMITVNQALQEAKTVLEEQVQERTNELVKTNHELQKLVQQQKMTQKKLSHDALHDSLTGLPNRNLFIDRLLQAMKGGSRNHLKYAVLFIDLDRFKVINDSLGHLTGDLLLKEVSHRLEKTLRQCDSIARFGGDEFCILLEGNITKAEVITITERIITIVSEPYTLQGYEVFTSPSVGITLSQSYYTNPEDVLRDSDAAMYQAKSMGKACFAIFDSSMHNNALLRLQLENDLRVAVKANEIIPYFQPILDLSQGTITSLESLARWNHHSEGFVKPDVFINIAEETGLIQQLGKQVLEKSLQTLAHWRSLDNRLNQLSVSVNLSPRQLEDDNLVTEIVDMLKQYDLPPNCLKLEITEGVLIDRFESAKKILNQFSEAGIKIMLDDFGTGFSSLSYLHHFPISIVKIDRSFIANMFKEATDMAIIQSVQNLAEGLNMKVVAEGIENQSEVDKLRQMHIDYGQGYLLSKPLTADDTFKFLQRSANKYHQKSDSID